DLIALLALVVAKPELKGFWEQPRSILVNMLGRTVAGLAGVSLLLGLLVGLSVYFFGSTDAALAYLRGERISIRPNLVDVGEGSPGETRVTAVEVVNRTDHEIRLIGGTSDCSCVATDDLPVSVPSGESRWVTVRMRLRGPAGIFTRRAAFLADEDGIQPAAFRLTGRIREAPRDSQSQTAKRG